MLVKRRKMSRLQLKYFGKKHKKVSALRHVKRKKRVIYMAKRYHKKGGGRRGFGGGWKSMLAPILGGVADSYLDPMLPIDGIGATASGMFLHSPTTRDIGLYKVGMSIGNIIPLPGRSGGSSGGGFI
jgi:hypothetical protein